MLILALLAVVVTGAPTTVNAAPAIVQKGSAPSAADPFYFHAADLGILQAKAVQKEIGITEAQRAKLNTFAARHTDHLKALAAEYKAAGKKEQDATKDPRLIGYFLELKKNVMAQLSAAQLKRLGELSLQHLGLASLTDDQVGARVGLSAKQIESLRNYFEAGSKAYGEAEKAAASPVIAKYKDKHVNDQKAAEALQKQFDAEMGAAMRAAAPKLIALKSDTEKKMRAVMTAKQQADYKALLGKPFTP